jgi:small subunit ribosomal protein S15
MVVKKEKVDFRRHEKDTGSPEFQIVLVSTEIEVLQSHLAAHKKDFDAKRSILKKVAKRRSLLRYLKSTNLDTYMAVSKKFGIK